MDETLKQKYPWRFKEPRIDPTAWIASGAKVFGDVKLGAHSSVWFNSVIRGDVNFISIGENTNIQDLTMVHVSFNIAPTIIGNNVTVGHSAILHACTVADFVMIGMGSQILDEAEIGEYVVLGAGSLVTPKTKIPAYSKAYGRPAKVVAEVTQKEIEWIRWSAKHYVALSQTYRSS